MKKNTVIYVALFVVLIIIAVYTSSRIINTPPLTKEEQAKIEKEVEDKIVCIGHGNMVSCELIIFESPIFQLVKVSETGEENGYQFDENRIVLRSTPQRVDLAPLIRRFAEKPLPTE